MGTAQITPDLPVDDIMRIWPATIHVFLRRGMACVGCAMAPFHTVVDAGAEYHVAVATLLRELRDAARAGGRAESSPGDTPEDYPVR